MAFLFDIDNTLTEPLFYQAGDVAATGQWYVKQGIVTAAEIGWAKQIPHLYLVPQIAITHIPMAGAVEAVRSVSQQGIHYFTVRNHFDEELTKRIHRNTHLWLEKHAFPCHQNVQFFWDVADKLLHALKIPGQHTIIDDRPGGLLKAFREIQSKDPKAANDIQERITLVAFGFETTEMLALPEGLKVFPLARWSLFSELLSPTRRSS